MTAMKCPKCHTQRSIKAGTTLQKKPKQKYYCYKCMKFFTGPIQNNRAPIINSSGITEEELVNNQNDC